MVDALIGDIDVGACQRIVSRTEVGEDVTVRSALAGPTATPRLASHLRGSVLNGDLPFGLPAIVVVKTTLAVAPDTKVSVATEASDHLTAFS